MKKILLILLLGPFLFISSCKLRNNTELLDNIYNSPLYESITPFLAMWELTESEKENNSETLLLLLSSDDVFVYSVTNDSDKVSSSPKSLYLYRFSKNKLELISEKKDKLYTFEINNNGDLLHSSKEYPSNSNPSKVSSYHILLDH